MSIYSAIKSYKLKMFYIKNSDIKILIQILWI